MDDYISKAVKGSCVAYVTGIEEHNMDFAIFINPQDDDDEPDITGNVKWDGCINWQTNPSCMAHYCNREQMDDFNSAFKWIYDEAGERIINADQSAF